MLELMVISIFYTIIVGNMWICLLNLIGEFSVFRAVSCIMMPTQASTTAMTTPVESTNFTHELSCPQFNKAKLQMTRRMATNGRAKEAQRNKTPRLNA